ncbi:hypothetical protein E3T43_07095 [Cryobacterium sp. Hh7]|uniref:hypothetical protein n=1 Tax=Cryobacterium sp. Hh7 TaxID=1259159 RepID=UPI00106B1649|nr:hypothetical protein [Cryobacterium sp. Hh7]TFD58008.1 hypothetical protein E3T43_07095 [Cryobacterium sp. Hh7]
MAERSFPFVRNAGTTTVPGTTSDAEYSEMFRLLASTGVIYGTDGGGLKPFANSSGLNVFVPAGRAFVRGHYYKSDAVVTLPISAGESLGRIDSVILRMEYAGVNDIHLVILKGEPSANPVRKAVTQTETGVYELLLGTVTAAINAVTITSTVVADARTFSNANGS